jgi:hypothetical protein
MQFARVLEEAWGQVIAGVGELAAAAAEVLDERPIATAVVVDREPVIALVDLEQLLEAKELGLG